ncbi:MAG: hypothetical protein EOO85_23100 [Pedobacter sp.]|nr:MAG: hypothetical protein EOO85_23100 [Pedobacter sp.]
MAKGLKKADSFYDNDAAVCLATTQLIEKVPQTKDNSFLYTGHNDYNDKHREDLSQVPRQASPA